MKARQILVVFAVAIVAASAADAAIIDLINSQEIGYHWGQASGNAVVVFYWSDSLAPHAGDDYVVGDDAGKTLRTPEGFSSTFAGDSLTVRPSGQLLLKSNNDARVYTVNDFIFDGGNMTHGSDNRTITIDGYATVLSPSNISNSGNNARRLNFDMQLSGSAQLNVIVGNGDWVRLRDDNSAFSGTWNISFGTGSGSGTPYVDAQAEGSLGTGDIIVGAGVMLDIDYDRQEYYSSLVLNGMLTLDQALGFQSVTIGGTTLPYGVYSYAWLNSNFDLYFVDGAFEGSITIALVPEPATLGLVGLGLAALARRRRRP